jgi:hypothetical protein
VGGLRGGEHPRILNRAMSPFLACAALVCANVIAHASPHQEPAPKPAPKPAATGVAAAPDPRAAEDERARAAFAKLDARQRQEVIDFLEDQVRHLGTFQQTLIAWTIGQQDKDPTYWPELAPPPIFDPTVHAPAQPIPRRVLDAGSAAARKAAASILGRDSALPGAPPKPGKPPVRKLVRGFVYDYASGELRRVTAQDEPQRVLENALAGYPPRLDLCEALIERMLDDGSQRKRAEAFAHAYSDRSGNVFPGITLFDAYSAGVEVEMPDVEVLGIVHVIFDDWDTWKAPIPGREQDPLYEKVIAEFTALHRHRTLRHAIAITFACGTDVLRDGYQGNLDNFHALWEDCSSTPEKLKARLPTPEKRSEFLEAWVKRCLEKDSPYRAGQNRRAVLDGNAYAVRATVFHVLEEYGALERKPPDPPTPEAKKPEAGKTNPPK